MWVQAVWVQLVLICALNVCLVCIGPRMAVDCAGSLSEPLSCDFSGIVTEGFTIPETVFIKIYFCENMGLVK